MAKGRRGNKCRFPKRTHHAPRDAPITRSVMSTASATYGFTGLERGVAWASSTIANHRPPLVSGHQSGRPLPPLSVTLRGVHAIRWPGRWPGSCSACSPTTPGSSPRRAIGQRLPREAVGLCSRLARFGIDLGHLPCVRPFLATRWQALCCGAIGEPGLPLGRGSHVFICRDTIFFG